MADDKKPAAAKTPEKKEKEEKVDDASTVADDLNVFEQFNTIPGGVSVSAFAGASGISESEAEKRLTALTEQGRLTATQGMGGPLTYFLSQPLDSSPKVPEGGPPEMGSIDTREDIDTRPLEQQRADADA